MASKAEILEYLQAVKDPEIPVLAIEDLGIIREVLINDNEVHVQISPTYSGCPAMDMIEVEIKAALQEQGFESTVELVLAPAWSTDWITPKGRSVLEEYGIAAPLEESVDKRALMGEANIVKCVNCGSHDTKMVSQFGSTACKALFQCNVCYEPFDYFKCLK